MAAWLAPNHYLPWTAFYNDLPGAIALLILALATCTHKDMRGSVIITTPALVLFFVAFLPLLQLIFGKIVFSGDAWIASLYLAGLALAYVIGYQLTRDFRTKVFESLAWLLLLSSLISLFIALHQWLLLDGLGIWQADLRPGGRPFANLAQPNNLATLFCLGLIAAFYLREIGHIKGATIALLVATLLGGVALTGSRTPFVIAIVLISWILWSRRRIGLSISPTQIILGLLVYIFFLNTLPALSEILYIDIPTITERTQSSLRLVIWAQLLDAVINGPWFGYGWNQVSFAQVAVAAYHPQSVMIEHSHNIVLDLLVWNGILIGGALIIALSWWMFTRLKHCPSKESWFGLAAILVVATHGLVELPLEYAYFLLPIGLCAGAVDNCYPQRQFKLPGWTLAIPALAGWLLVAWVFVEYQAIESAHREMRFKSRYPVANPNPLPAPKVIILTQLSEFIKFTQTEAKENMTEDELDWMQLIAHRYPYPPALFRYALALGLNHRYDEASLELIRLKKIHPPDHIEEAVVSWHELSERYPQLKKVPLP